MFLVFGFMSFATECLAAGYAFKSWQEGNQSGNSDVDKRLHAGAAFGVIAFIVQVLYLPPSPLNLFVCVALCGGLLPPTCSAAKCLQGITWLIVWFFSDNYNMHDKEREGSQDTEDEDSMCYRCVACALRCPHCASPPIAAAASRAWASA